MTSTLIQANDCLFQVKIGDDFVSVLCAKSFTVTITTDEKETTTVSDGAYKTFDYKVLSYTANLNNAMRLPDALTPTQFDFVNYQQSFLQITFRAVWIDPSGAVRAFVGNGIVKSNNMVSSASQIADGTVDILGTGSFEITDTIVDFVNLTIISTGNDTAPAFIKIWLLNDNGDVIFLSDTLPQATGSYLDNPQNLVVAIPAGMWYFYYYVDTNTVGNSLVLNAPPTLTVNFNNGVTQANSYPNQKYDFTVNRTVTITLGVNNPPPTCVAPSIVSDLNNPSGTVGTPWHGTILLAGSQPFNITGVTKPAGMSINVSGNVISLDWPAPDAGINQDIIFDINNACGTIHFADTIDIASNPDAILLNFSYSEGSGVPANAGAFHLYVNAVLVAVFLSNNSSNYICNPGDVVEVQVVGAFGQTKHIDIVDSIAGTIYNNSTTLITLSTTFTATLGHDYTITATHGL